MAAEGEGWVKAVVREFGVDMYTLLYLKWITNTDLLCSTWNSAQCYVPAWMGGVVGGEWIQACVWLSPSSSVQFSHSVVSDSLQPHELQHARLPCPLPSPGACSNSCPLSL